jgi:hypothetical protein
MIPDTPNTANGTRSPSTTTIGASIAPNCAACVAHPKAAFRTTVGNSSAVYMNNRLYVAAIPKIPTTPHAILTNLQYRILKFIYSDEEHELDYLHSD